MTIRKSDVLSSLRKHNGATIGKETRHYLQEAVVDPALKANWDEASRVVLLTELTKPVGRNVYAIRVTLRKPDGSLIAPDLENARFVICTRTFDTIPKP
jgi:hypothetical protein